MINPELQNYIDWRVKSVIKLKDRNNYAYRVILLMRMARSISGSIQGLQQRKKLSRHGKLQWGNLPTWKGT